MSPPPVPPLAGLVLSVAALSVAAQIYLRRYELPRPPVGVYRWADIVFMTAAVLLAPPIYLAMPGPVVAGIFGAVILAAVQLTLAPILGGRPALAVALVGTLATAAAALAHQGLWVMGLTDGLLAIALVGVANLWVQGGMRASHVAVLAGLIATYDLVATGLTTVTARFVAEVQGLPFAPVFALTRGVAPVAIGLGDLLMLLLFPLAVHKAFGALASRAAAVLSVGTVGVIGALFGLGVLRGPVPLMTVLGPIIVAQYAWWRRRGYRERTTSQWRAAAPVDPSGAVEPDAVGRALLADPGDLAGSGTWIAIVDDVVVGSGGSAGLARRAAREARVRGVPVVRQV
jgi:hypothetical protein